jgi:hypothetical protein
MNDLSKWFVNCPTREDVERLSDYTSTKTKFHEKIRKLERKLSREVDVGTRDKLREQLTDTYTERTEWEKRYLVKTL